MFRVIDLPGAEARLGYTFVDKHLGTAALPTDRLRFSRVEYLGDAIMELSEYTIATCRDIPHTDTDQVVSNKNLDEVHSSRVVGCSYSETIDVVAALIPAVYLDGGSLSATPVVASLLPSEHRDFEFATTRDLASTSRLDGSLRSGRRFPKLSLPTISAPRAQRSPDVERSLGAADRISPPRIVGMARRGRGSDDSDAGDTDLSPN